MLDQEEDWPPTRRYAGVLALLPRPSLRVGQQTQINNIKGHNMGGCRHGSILGWSPASAPPTRHTLWLKGLVCQFPALRPLGHVAQRLLLLRGVGELPDLVHGARRHLFQGRELRAFARL